MPTPRQLVREASALGAKFRICGADVVVDGIDNLAQPLRAELQIYVTNGFIYDLIGGNDADAEATGFLQKLGVTAVLVADRAGAIAAVEELSRAEWVGLDIETAPKREFADPRPAIAINADGSISATQKRASDGAGLDPHLAEIASLQLYAGGARCFVFRGEALRLMLASRWLRQQRLVCHNAGIEVAFLRHHTTPIEGVKGHPIECTMQAGGRRRLRRRAATPGECGKRDPRFGAAQGAPDIRLGGTPVITWTGRLCGERRGAGVAAVAEAQGRHHRPAVHPRLRAAAQRRHPGRRHGAARPRSRPRRARPAG
jgi:hypothetical protein